MQHATKLNFYWNVIDSSHSFQTSLENEKKQIGEPVDKYWRKDEGEKVTRIWEWWKPIVENEPNYLYFSLALKFISMIQVSSCAVERVFSQMRYVIDVCWLFYKDNLEFCMFAGCNGNLDPLWIEAFNSE